MKLDKPLAAILALLLLAGQAVAGSVEPRDGWEVHDTGLGYQALIDSLKQAVDATGMAVVTEAGPTEAAASRGVDIPGNRVLGVFRNDLAVRTLEASVPAMIEAPIRFYVTEDEDGTATLSYKTPSHVFAPYMAEDGGKLGTVAAELDAIFADIARRAIGG